MRLPTRADSDSPREATSAVRRAPVWLVVVATVTLFVAGVFVAYTLALGCGENLYPWPPNTRYEFCNAIDYDVTPIAIAFVPPFIAAIVGFFVPRRVFARVVALLVLSLGVFFVIVIGATA